jgi:hypothetical protein
MNEQRAGPGVGTQEDCACQEGRGRQARRFSRGAARAAGGGRGQRVVPLRFSTYLSEMRLAPVPRRGTCKEENVSLVSGELIGRSGLGFVTAGVGPFLPCLQ